MRSIQKRCSDKLRLCNSPSLRSAEAQVSMSWRRVLPNVSASGAGDATTYADQGTRETNLQYVDGKRIKSNNTDSPLFRLYILEEILGSKTMTQQHPTPPLQRKQGEDATYQLASIIESSGDAILSKTLEGMITLWNRSAEELYGYARDEILGQSVSRLIPPDRQQELPAILERIKAGEAIGRFETVRVKKDGTLIDVSVRISPIRDAQGSIFGVSAIAHDIAEEKRIAEELARGSRELERMNSELQHQRNQLLLLNAALAEAQRGRQFFSTMSHELRTPLASIIGFSQLLLEGAATGDLSRQQQNNLERILKNGQHLLNLINNVLDLEKIEAGRMEVTYNQVDVRELLNWVVEETQSLAIAHHLDLHAVVQDGVDSLETSPVKLRQIMLNLVSNALKFTEQGEVTVSAARVDAEHLALAVQDTGVGIPTEMQERIFEAFYQVEGGYTRKVGGTGLGLSIVRQMTMLLGGTITLSSAPGQGSTFTVILPIKAVQQALEAALPRLNPELQPDVPTISSSSAEHTPDVLDELLAGSARPEATSLQPNLVLAVDDNPDILALIKAALQDTYTVVGVQEPKKVMDLAQVMHPQAIILDVMLPDLNGWQLLHQLKSDPATAAIPVAMLSVLTEPVTGYVLGADEYLIKPFKSEVVLKTLERLITSRQSRRGVATPKLG